MIRRSRPLVVPVAALALVASLGGCATAQDYANEPRPATPVTLAGALTASGLSLDPTSVGAGPVKILVSNQTERATALRLQTAGTGEGTPGLRAQTQRINPGGTATLSVQVDEGDYELEAVGTDARPVAVTVGEPRPSSSSELLLP